MVLERLALHARDGLQFVRRVVLVGKQLFEVRLAEARQLHVEVRVAFADALDDAPQVALVDLGQLRKAVVGKKVRHLSGIGFIRLLVHRHALAADEDGGLQPAVAANDKSAPLRDGDRRAPALLLYDRGKELDLMGAVPVRIGGIGP